MKYTYTVAAKERCFGLVDGGDLDRMWEGIFSMPKDVKPDECVKAIQSISAEYLYSSRFALMRFLQRRNVDKEQVQTDPSVGFCVKQQSGRVIYFEDISLEHAEKLTEQELQDYQVVLEEMANEQKDANSRTNKSLIRKALLISNDKPMSREDALRLGHVLRFSLREIEWFLLRVCDREGTLHNNRAEDLIHAFTFLSGASLKDFCRMQQKYEEKYAYLERTGDDTTLEEDWTLSIEETLEERFEYWDTNHHDTIEDCFLRWMEGIAPYLGRSSRTALRVYRNLVAYAYCITTERVLVPDVVENTSRHAIGHARSAMYNAVRNILSMPALTEEAEEVLCREGSINGDLCKEVAKKLTRENAYESEYKFDNLYRKGWCSLVLDDAGKPKPHHAHMLKFDPVRSGKLPTDRVAEILMGDMPVEKADMLYVIWYIAFQCWAYGDIHSADLVSAKMKEFCRMAEDCLSSAGLPDFYPAHLMEQALLLSVALAYTPEDSRIFEPQRVYGLLVEAVLGMVKNKK